MGVASRGDDTFSESRDSSCVGGESIALRACG